jgi:F-type H+-transporting ATPase subunit beta
MSNGTVTQIIGAVIDVEFEKDNIPKVYEALLIDEVELPSKFSNN